MVKELSYYRVFKNLATLKLWQLPLVVPLEKFYIRPVKCAFECLSALFYK